MFKGVVFWGLTALFHRYETFTVAGMSKGRCRYGRQQGQRRGANASLEFENDGVICCSTVKYSEISLFNLAFASNLLECSLFFFIFRFCCRRLKKLPILFLRPLLNALNFVFKFENLQIFVNYPRLTKLKQLFGLAKVPLSWKFPGDAHHCCRKHIASQWPHSFKDHGLYKGIFHKAHAIIEFK